MSGSAFTEEEDDYMLRFAADGPKAIAKALGRNRTSVHGRMRRLGLSFEVRNRVEWNRALDAGLAKLCKEGLSDKDIAARIGCSECSVGQRRRLLKIEKPRLPLAQTERALKRRREMARAEPPAVTAPTDEEAGRDAAFVDRLLADGGMPRLSERIGKSGHPVASLPLVWDHAPHRRVAA